MALRTEIEMLLGLVCMCLASACDAHVHRSSQSATEAGQSGVDAGPTPTGSSADAQVDLDDADARTAICDDKVGLVEPLPTCSTDSPCTYVAAEVGMPLVTPSDAPDCTEYDDALTFNVQGTTRYACVRRPANLAQGPRPLVIFLHPGGEGVEAAKQTSLIEKAEGYDLGDAAGLGGFVLAVVQGRNLHFPTAAPRDGRHHDFYHRDLNSTSKNPDIRALDMLVDDLVESGDIEPARIYVMGWSNGGFFGQLYAIARHETPTPGMNYVAAAAVFAAASPFDDIERDPFAGRAHSGPTCKLAMVPSSNVPIQLTYRSCDAAVPCGPSDGACFAHEPGFVTQDWLATAQGALPGLVGRRIAEVELRRADTYAASCTSIDSACSQDPCTVDTRSAQCLCLVNHLRWPDGVYESGSGVDNEPSMLDFLRDHPLPAR